MAVVLDVHLLCNRMIKISVIKNFFRSYKIKIDSICSIENWLWENEKKIKNLDCIVQIVNQNKIIIIKLVCPLFRDLGIYIEKVEKEYLYTFWFHTEGYPELDCDTINKKNEIYYKKIEQSIFYLQKIETNLLKIAGIGIESDFYYSKNILDIVQKSYNMLLWIF